MNYKEVLKEFIEVQNLTGYVKPTNLSDIECCPTDDERYIEEDSRCPVDRYLKKDKGLR